MERRTIVYDWNRYLAFFLLTLGVLFNLAIASPQTSQDDSNDEQEEFWPADMIPHPHIPGTGPNGTSETEMV